MNTAYKEFLESKVVLHQPRGIDIDPSELHPSTLDHQRDTILWAAKTGCALLGLKFGLGKTHIQIELCRLITKHQGGRAMIVAPLGVRHQFMQEDGPRLGVTIEYVKTNEEIAASTADILITNYERYREGSITDTDFTIVCLDEGAVMRSLGAKTYHTFNRIFKNVKFRFVGTATPSPNRYLELLQYSEFLGVMDKSQAKTRFFKRDSQKANNLTLHPHHEHDFWIWVSSWALFLTKPSDMGYGDEGYDLPGLEIIQHEIPTDHINRQEFDEDGEMQMFVNAAKGLSAAAKEKKASMAARIQRMVQIIEEDEPDAHWLLWHHREAERELIEKAVPDVVSIYGTRPIEDREEDIIRFSHGEIKKLATKPSLSGSGCNFQHHCHRNIFVGIDYDFEDFIQSIHRTFRFQQKYRVIVHIIHTEAEREVLQALMEKWKAHDELMERMREVIKLYGLDHSAAVRDIGRAMDVQRMEFKGALFHAVRNDTVEEIQTMPDNSVDLIVTSIPFGNQYEYSANYRDFGHNLSNDRFWQQMEFLIPDLLRILKPGRIAAIHVKDRIAPGNYTGLGFPTMQPFSDETSLAFRRGGFALTGRITIVTDVVRENAQTYRLGWSENCKDGTKMSVGMPEYILLFRKRPTDLSNGYADEPVTKSKEDYTRGQWQVDAHSFWRSSGDRLLTVEEISKWDQPNIMKWFKDRDLSSIYDYHRHIALNDALASKGKLSTTFMMLPPQSTQGHVWTDIHHFRGLNAEQLRKGAEAHICPLPFDIVERLIGRFTNAPIEENGILTRESVFDPFAGIMTVPYCAIKMGRTGKGCELGEEYWRCGVEYLKAAEYKATVPTLFDMLK
jgi:SAM-dependent methyltransferase